MKSITPCLWFADNAEEAAKFYTSTFKNSKITAKTYYGKNMHLPEGTILTISMEISGQEFMILNGGPLDTFNHSISFYVPCKTQGEIDDIWDKILKAGGQEEQCGWIRDQYGVCWQIAPENAFDMITDKNPAKVQAYMDALMKMIKLDKAALEKAYKEAA